MHLTLEGRRTTLRASDRSSPAGINASGKIRLCLRMVFLSVPRSSSRKMTGAHVLVIDPRASSHSQVATQPAKSDRSGISSTTLLYRSSASRLVAIVVGPADGEGQRLAARRGTA